MLQNVYELYCEHVTAEVERLHSERGFSLTWALGEATWLIDSLLPSSYRPGRAQDYDALLQACAEVPAIVLETDGSRTGVSPKQLSKYESFWTVDSLFFSSAETLLREIPGSAAISQLASNLGTESLVLPPGPYISMQRPRSIAQGLAFRDREVNRIDLRRDQRRVDLRWAHVSKPPLWRSGIPESADAKRALVPFLAPLGIQFSNEIQDLLIGQGQVECVGFDEEVAIRSLGRTFIVPGTRYSQYLMELLDKIEASPDAATLATYAIAIQAITFITGSLQQPGEFVRQQLAQLSRTVPLSASNLSEDPELVSLLQSTVFKSFNPQSWIRGQQPGV